MTDESILHISKYAMNCAWQGERISRHNSLRDSLHHTAVKAALGPTRGEAGRCVRPPARWWINPGKPAISKVLSELSVLTENFSKIWKLLRNLKIFWKSKFFWKSEIFPKIWQFSANLNCFPKICQNWQNCQKISIFLKIFKIVKNCLNWQIVKNCHQKLS